MSYITYVESKDGTKLYTKVNRSEEHDSTIIIVHGLAEYAERYDKFVDELNMFGSNIVRFDHRGHGHSEGKDTYYGSYEEIIEDVKAVVDYVKENIGPKIYLIGHSMGGFAVTLYGTKYPGTVDGYITSGALTRYHTKLFEGAESLGPEEYFPNEIGEGLCSKASVVEEYKIDALIKKHISGGLVHSLLEGVEYLKEHAKDFVDPIMILHGKNDGAVSPEDSIDLYREIGSEHKSLHIFPKFEHEIFHENTKFFTFSHLISSWIMELEPDEDE